MKKINQFGMNLYQPYTVYPATSTNRLTFDLRSKEAYHGGHIEGTSFHMIKISSIKLAPVSNHNQNQLIWRLSPCFQKQHITYFTTYWI